ncbi:MAG: FecR domain-containing protein [Acetobacteraceae bacterium]|nr:FecR domain-containing protein [Acetobacteraceae bacterium]
MRIAHIVSPAPLRRRVVCRAALGSAAASAWLRPSPGHADEPTGKVESLRGQAFAQAGARRRALTQAGDVFIGDLVATAANSALELLLGATTHVRLGAEAQLRIDRFLVEAGGVLELARGPMLFDRDETAPKADTAIRSPFGLIAVRGTRFFAGPSNGVFGVFVARGRVTVVGASTAVEVTDGLGTDIAAPGANPTAPHPWGPARIQRAFADVQ